MNMCVCCENELAVRNDVCGPCGDELEILDVKELAAEFDRKFGPDSEEEKSMTDEPTNEPTEQQKAKYLRSAMQHALYWACRVESAESERLAHARDILERALARLYDGTTTLAGQSAPRDVVPLPYETIARLEAKVTQLEAALMATGGQSFANVFEPLGERCGYDLGEGLGQCQNLPTQVIRMACPVCDEHANVEQFPVAAPPPSVRQ